MTYIRNLLIIGVLTTGLCGASGCSGKKPAAQPVVQNANPIPAVPAPAAGNGGAANAPPESAENPLHGAKAGSDSTEGEPPGPDDFVLSTDRIITEVESPKPPPAPASFEVSLVPAGMDSTNLVIVGVVEQTGDASVATNSAGNASNPEAALTGVRATNPGTPQTPKTQPVNAAPATTTSVEPLTLPKGFTAVPGSPNDPETELPFRIRGERDTVEMVLIIPGVFLRGADVPDPVVSPRHTVLMEHAYYIDTVEVSVGRYNAFREFYRKNEGRRLDASANHDGNPDLPAVGMKFFDAKFYAKWTNKELPTETQWERAGRGDRGFDYPWGEGRPVFQLPRVIGQLDPVGTFPGDRSAFGVYDMAGNAREWCLDLFQADIYQKEISQGAGTVRDPVGPKSAPGIKQQVIRGGHSDWAIWHRAALPQNETAPDIGFRCVLNVVPSAKPKSDKGDKTDKTDKKSDEKKKNALKF